MGGSWGGKAWVVMLGSLVTMDPLHEPRTLWEASLFVNGHEEACGLVGVTNSIAVALWIILQYTINGKKVEVAVKQIIAGKEVEQRGIFSNPGTLDLYRDIPELQNF